MTGPAEGGVAPPPGDPTLYQALLDRHSVRRYDDREVPEDARRAIAEHALKIEPLEPGNEFTFSLLPIVGKSEELAAVMGGYGRLVSARHLLLPRIRGDSHVLEDFGFRVEQLVIELTRQGLASCWIAALGHEAEALDRAGAARDERIPGVVVFGYAASNAAARGFNSSIRLALGANRPPAFERWVFDRTFGSPADLSPFRERALEALRRAPSAGNSRPWRVVIRDDDAFLVLVLDTPYYRMSKGVRLGYHRLDGGIGMANLSLALRALDRPLRWTMLDDDPGLRTELALPDGTELLARITLPAG